MENIKIWSLFLFVLVLNLLTGCGTILKDEGKIIGRVRLSDNPPEGHGGVLVSTSSISTTTANDGSFELIGTITGEGIVYVYFEKQGYKSRDVEAEIPYPSGEDKNYCICDLGEVVLEKI